MENIFQSTLILILAGLLFISGCTSKQNVQTNQNPPANTPPQANSYANQLSGCAKLSDVNREKDFCITNIAIEQKDPTICDANDLSASGFKYECRAQVFAKLDKCLELSPPALKAICFGYMAEQKGNVAICDRIKEINLTGWEDNRDFCYETYYGIITPAGFTKKNYGQSTCEKLLTKKAANTCYYSLAKNSYDASFCDKMVIASDSDKLPVDSCYYEIAVKNNDGALCAKIGGNDASQRCYYIIAKTKVDASLCDKIPTKETVKTKLVQDCLTNGGAQITCSQLSGNSLRSQCFYDIAAKQKDKSICEKLTDQYEKEYCQGLAENGTNSS